MRMYFEFLILLHACWAQPVSLPVIQAPAHALNQTTLKHWQFFSLLLGSTLVSAWAPCLGAGAAAGGTSMFYVSSIGIDERGVKQ